MADKKISQLTNLTGANLADNDEFVLVDTSADETKAITWSELKEGLDTGTGFVRITGDTMTGDLSFGDNDKAIFGAGSDLQIWHDGSNSYVKDAGTGVLNVQGSSQVNIGGANGTIGFQFVEGANASLRHNNALKLSTTSTGIDVTGTVTADGLSVDGNITSTGGDLNLDTLDLNAIAESKAVTAVDVFVYDTSKDSDGGAWRKRTQGTSWYNETLNTATRGSRKEFPAVAVIVVDNDGLYIYDGDDPDLPMWMKTNDVASGMILNNGNANAVTAKNGIIALASSSALWVMHFVDDRGDLRNSARRYDYKGNIEQRNDGLGYIDRETSGALTSAAINDVAMTVLPNAPIDAATGLPVPTIAVATEGGVSVIKDDGTVVDIVHIDSASTIEIWLRDNLVIYNAAQFLHARTIPSEDVSAGVRYVANPKDTWFAPRFTSPTYSGASFQLHPTGSAPGQVLQWDNSVAIANSDRLNRATVSDVYGANNALANFTTSTYNTGWMNGDIKGAFLSDTDDTDLVGAELVTNGTFDTDTDWTKGTGWTIGSGVASCDGTQTDYSALQQLFALDTTQTYIVDIDFTCSAGQIFLRFGSTSSAGNIAILAVSGSYRYTVSPTATGGLTVLADANFVGTVDNISVKLADADRSVNNNGLIVNGTVTRSPVATGADLVAYSGFSASNYLEQPYNSDLDFGTGDFCVMGWVDGKRSNYNCFVNRTSDKSTASGLRIMDSGLSTILVTGYGSSLVGGSYPTDAWFYVCFVRSGGVGYTYINGFLAASGAWPVSVADPNATTTFGGYWVGGSLGAASPDLALWRTSATAPTAEQIAKIYEDEKVLFQENAQATLYGTSDAVTALAHDDATNLLHVGTSAGRSVFQGLRRVENTTTAVGTAISASNGLIAEE